MALPFPGRCLVAAVVVASRPRSVQSTEWWHFDAPGEERHPLRDEPLTAATGAD